jgi:Bacteriophage tail sheath protein
MPEYLSPGVYVEEIATGAVPIEGVSTSTAGFVGQTERGPMQPRLVTSWLDFQRWYGGYIDIAQSFLPYAIQGFFDNGGQRAYIARVTRAGAQGASFGFPAPNQNLTVRASGPGVWGNRVFVRIQNGTQPGTFRLTALYYRTDLLPAQLGPAPAAGVPPRLLVDPFDLNTIADPNRREPDVVEDYDNLRAGPLEANYFLTTINGGSQLLDLPAGQAPGRPNNNGGFDGLLNGNDGAAPPAVVGDYTGNAAAAADQRTGLAALELIDEIALLTVPDEVLIAAITEQVLLQCERLRERFAVLNTASGLGTTGAVVGGAPRNTNYAAVYWPWVRIFDPVTNDTVLVPPSGHVAGVYARTDIERGVHKAPANEDVRGIITRDLSGNRRPLEFTIGKREHDILNPQGINVIRDFRADRRGIRVWGARTRSVDPNWKYVNVRRLFIFLEESIDEGTQWVVFEPNDEPTWARVRRSISNFLIRVWRDGALAGATEEEAFFVKCDRTTMTEDDIVNGRLICYIGVAPVRPAEFVIFRISQKTVEATS